MRRFLMVIILLLVISIPSVQACSPPSTDYFQIEVEDCENTDMYNVDVLVPENYIESIFIKESITQEYQELFPNYESFSYLTSLNEEKVYSHRAQVLSATFEQPGCFFHFKVDESTSLRELPYEAFYFIVFDDDGTEIMRSELLYTDIYSNSLGYLSVNFENQTITEQQLFFDGCKSVYEFVFGAMAALGLLLFTILAVVYSVFVLVLFSIIKRTLKMESRRVVGIMYLMKVLLILSYIVYIYFYSDIPDWPVSLISFSLFGVCEYLLISYFTKEESKSILLYVFIVNILFAFVFIIW